MKTTTAIAQSEFIGLKAKIARSSNPNYIGIAGKVVDETRNTLVIKQNREDKTVVKEGTVFQFTLQDGTVVEIEGDVIIGRPEDRMKKKLKRRW